MGALDIAFRSGGLVLSLAAIVWGLVQYRLGARKAETTAINARIDKLAGELAEHKEAGQTSRAELGQRLGNVEASLKHLPDKDSVHQLNIAVTEIRGLIGVQGEALKTVSATASRVETFLLDGGRR